VENGAAVLAAAKNVNLDLLAAKASRRAGSLVDVGHGP